MYLNQLEAITVIQTIFDDTTTNLSELLPTHMAFLIFTASLLSNSHKHQCTMQALLNKAMLALDRISLRSMEAIKVPLSTMPDHQLSQSRAWCPASP